MAPTKKSSQNDAAEKKKKKEGVSKKKMKLKKFYVRRTHFQYTEEALAQALDAIRNKNIPIREACRKYCVPRSTVQDRISGRMAEKPRKVGPEPILGFDGEQKVVDWIIDLAKCGIPVTKQQLLETVKNIIKDMGKAEKLPDGKRPGQTWYQNFLRRHPEISVREPESINKAREAVKESSIRKWFAELESFIAERGLEDMMKDPERILNADETGVSLCPATGKVLAPKGYKNVYTVKKGNEKETLTVLITMTASGKISPPLVVFPYVRPPKAVVQNMPEGWIIGKTQSGWMRTEVFYEYIANDFNNWLNENNVKKPVILFVDGHKSHMSLPLSEFCENNDIILYALPPNTTHITQPADVSVFRPLKQEWKKTVTDWQSRPENHNSTVTKTNFCKVFKEALDKDFSQSIKNGFRKCGLFPLNVEAVDYSKCVKDFQERRKKKSLSSSELTERDFIGAHKVLTYIKTNLLNKGIDTEMICKEIELAKKHLKEMRRSTSKTPRTSTEVARRSTSYSLEQTNIDKGPLDAVDNIGSSILEDIAIPDVGSLVSLNDIAIINISDLNLEQHSDKHTLIDTTKEARDNSFEQELSVSPAESTTHLKIVTVADVHNHSSLTDNTNTPEIIQIDSTSIPISNKENENIHINRNDIEIQIINDDDTLNLIDPFEKHLVFVDKVTNTKTKRKNINSGPSAISEKKWRSHYEKKDKEKEKKDEEKRKKKMERELKKIETAKAKKKNAEEKKRKMKESKEAKKTDKISTKNNICPNKGIKKKTKEINNYVAKEIDNDTAKVINNDIAEEINTHIQLMEEKLSQTLQLDDVEMSQRPTEKDITGEVWNSDEEEHIQFMEEKLSQTLQLDDVEMSQRPTEKDITGEVWNSDDEEFNIF